MPIYQPIKMCSHRLIALAMLALLSAASAVAEPAEGLVRGNDPTRLWLQPKHGQHCQHELSPQAYRFDLLRSKGGGQLSETELCQVLLL